MTSSLELLWKEIAPSGGVSAFRRVDERHPLDLYVGVAPGGARELLLLTDTEPPVVAVTPKGFDIKTGRRSDGRWALTVSLRMPELSKLFSHLCEDLVEASRTGCQRADAGRFVMERIARWSRLLARSPKTGLDERTYRGLLAELVVLHRLLIPAVGANVAIPAWVGPLDADQDFRLADRLVEVKSTVIGSLMITVSSAEQLDVHDFPMYLAAVPIGDGERGADETLAELIGLIRENIQNDSSALTTFDDRLGMTGYDPEDEYASRTFSIGTIHHFRVTDAFPAVGRSRLPAAIRTIRYELDLGMCRAFEVQGLFG
jgi:hypothetical protein